MNICPICFTTLKLIDHLAPKSDWQDENISVTEIQGLYLNIHKISGHSTN